MKIKFVLILTLITFLIFSFTSSSKLFFSTSQKIEKIEKKYIIGDFDGDRRTDTLNQITYLKNKKSILTDYPQIKDYDSLVDYYYKKNINVSYVDNRKKIKPLDLDICFGAYCLINIGDNNNDDKDEIAIAINYCDYSMLNSCKIYSLCNNKWTILKSFSINENSFFTKENELSYPNHIKDYLEYKNNKWFFSDALENSISEDTIIEMKPLLINKCN